MHVLLLILFILCSWVDTCQIQKTDKSFYTRIQQQFQCLFSRAYATILFVSFAKLNKSTVTYIASIWLLLTVMIDWCAFMFVTSQWMKKSKLLNHQSLLKVETVFGACSNGWKLNFLHCIEIEESAKDKKYQWWWLRVEKNSNIRRIKAHTKPFGSKGRLFNVPSTEAWGLVQNWMNIRINTYNNTAFKCVCPLLLRVCVIASSKNNLATSSLISNRKAGSQTDIFTRLRWFNTKCT